MAKEEPKPDPNNIMPDEPEPTPDPEPGGDPEPAPDPEPAKEKSYADLGLDARYDTMSREERVADIKHRNSVHHRHEIEMGKLRKENANLQEQFDGVKKAAGQPVAVKEAVADMSEAELGRWLEDLQSNPRKAFQQILGDNFGKRSEDDLNKLIGERFDEYIGQYHGYTEDRTVAADPDYQVHAGYIEGLRKPEHFGNTRSVVELLAFAKLANHSSADRNTVDPLFDYMKRFPEVPMADCLAMVKGRTGGAKTVDADKIREQVKSLDGTTPPGSNKASTSEEILDMDGAFDVDD